MSKFWHLSSAVAVRCLSPPLLSRASALHKWQIIIKLSPIWHLLSCFLFFSFFIFLHDYKLLHFPFACCSKCTVKQKWALISIAVAQFFCLLYGNQLSTN